MLNQINTLGEYGISLLENLGKSGLFLWHTVFRLPRIQRTAPLLMAEMYSIGVRSLLIIIVSALFIGMVVGLQGYNTLQKFGAAQQLGSLVALSVVRELGPVVTALLFAGRAGSALTAEVGLMKATEQLASMEMMGVDPLWRIISPRFWAGFFSMPTLSAIFSALAIFGGYLVGVEWLGLDAGTFWSNMQTSVAWHADVMNGLLKSVVFGFVATWIALYQGYACVPTAEGISRATTRSVVYASLAILGLDFVLTTTMVSGW